MSLEIVSPPRTIMEAFKSLPEGTLVELIDGIIIMSPMRNVAHQQVLGKICIEIHRFVDAAKVGEMFMGPLDTYLDENSNAVQPDLQVILKENLGIMGDDGYIHGSPNMVLEVFMPESRDHDLITKKELYERFGVKEYWVIDPADKLAIGYALENKRYSEFHRKAGAISSRLLDFSFEF